MHAINYFASYGDFYASGTQDAEVTKSLTGSVKRIYRVIYIDLTVPELAMLSILTRQNSLLFLLRTAQIAPTLTSTGSLYPCMW